MNEHDVHELAAASGLGGVIGLLVASFRGAILRKYGGGGAWFRGLGASLFVGVLTAWSMHDYVDSPFKTGSLIAFCSFIADDLLQGMTVVGNLIRENPIGFIGRLRDAWAGRRHDDTGTP
jgi:hypothetical protein